MNEHIEKLNKLSLRYKNQSVTEPKDVTKPPVDTKPSAPPLAELSNPNSLDNELPDINMPRCLSSVSSQSKFCGSLDSVPDIKMSRPLTKTMTQPMSKPVLNPQRRIPTSSNYHDTYASETKTIRQSSLGFRNLPGSTLQPTPHTSQIARTQRNYNYSDAHDLYHQDSYGVIRSSSSSLQHMPMPTPHMGPSLHSVRQQKFYPQPQAGCNVSRQIPRASMYNSMSMPSLVNVGPDIRMNDYHSQKMYMNPRVHPLDPLDGDNYWSNRATTSDYDLCSAPGPIGFENVNHSPRARMSNRWMDY